ncbi:hypothetical protein M422DRAFT_249288, partial [Sphaerobolus stellatus SS14]
FGQVHFAIERWKSGQYVHGGYFKESEYHTIYKQHLRGLERWRNFSPNTAKTLARYQQKLFEFCSGHAGFDVSAPPLPTDDPFTQDKLALAAAALNKE